jgi:aspartyl/asparaginyl-tRNA synthetase
MAFEDYPINVGAGKEFLLDKRHLHIRSPTVTAILKVKAIYIQAAREWLGLINVACEGGATLFPVDYFKRKAYLSQSVQQGKHTSPRAFNSIKKPPSPPLRRYTAWNPVSEQRRVGHDDI